MKSELPKISWNMRLINNVLINKTCTLNALNHIYNSEILRVTENCHGDEGCPRADCVDGVDSVVTMVCVMYDVYSDQ